MERRLNRRIFVDPETQLRLLVEETAQRYTKHAKLERVLGCTASSSCALAVDERTGVVAYPAGSTVILHNPRTHKQAHLIGTKNSLTCIAFSPDGRHIATGEAGHEPRVRIWEVYDKDDKFVGQQVIDLKKHTSGISCVKFLPSSSVVVSVGNQYDKSICAWNWKTGKLVSENRVASIVHAMDVNGDGSMVVTAGAKHIKFWHMNDNAVMQGRAAILGDRRNSNFVDVCFGPGNRVFAITDTSNLVELVDKQLVNTYDMHGCQPFSLAVSRHELFIGFAGGLIRVLSLNGLSLQSTIPLPHFLGYDVSKAVTLSALNTKNHPKGARYPDVRAMVLNRSSNILSVIYADRSLYSWEILENGNLRKLSSQLHHVGSIRGVEVYPSNFSYLPAGSFLTAGADDTIRIWNIDKSNSIMDQSALSQRNVYSEELRKILFVGESIESLMEPSDRLSILGTERLDEGGVKCLRVSTDGRHLAAGFRNGNLVFIDLSASGMPPIAQIDAHDSDVLCIEYTDPTKGGPFLVASGGRDRLVHVFDPLHNYQNILTISDHSSAVNSVKFVMSSEGFRMFTCASDKVVVIRKLVDAHEINFERINQVSTQTSLNDMTLSTDGEGILTACQDRNIRVFSLSGKLVKTIRGTAGDDGNGALTKMCLDPSGTFAATVCSDRFVYVVDAKTGECVAVLTGQSESVNAVAFTTDCRRLVVVSNSGCIFVWRLSSFLSKKMSKNLKTNENVKGNERSRTPDSLIESGSDATSEEYNANRLGVKLSRGDPTIVSSSLQNTHDLESEFGSLSSIRIADEDEDQDSCIGSQKADVVVESPMKDVASGGDFEVHCVPASVVRRRSSSNLVAQPANWDVASTANDFSDDESAVGSSSKRDRSPMNGPAVYTQSRSMSNLRVPMLIEERSGSPRRPRRKWAESTLDNDMNISPPQQQQPANSTPQRPPQLPPHGFMTMTGSPTYHTPSAIPGRLQENTYMNGSISLNGLHERSLNPSVSSTMSHQTPPGVLRNGSRQYRTSEDGRYPNSSASSAYQSPFANNYNSSLSSVGVSSPSVAALLRTTEERNSLSKRALKTGGTQISHADMSEPRTVWTPPITSRRTSSNMHYSSPSGAAAAAITRRQDDYANSDLHLRSRSQSPNQLALDAKNSASRRRQDSDMSMRSGYTLQSSRLTPASSRTNLANLNGELRKSSQAIDRIAEARDKLRKSQENLAVMADAEGLSATSSLISRSKSIGNLRVAPPLTTQSADRPRLASKNNGLSPLSMHSRAMARSVGSLNQNGDDDTENAGMYGLGDSRQRGGANKASSRLALTIQGLKKASNPDLTNEALYQAEDESSTVTGYDYSTASLPRNQRKGAVQKRVERYQPKSAARIQRTDTPTSGESDSNASDASPLGGSSHARYFHQQKALNRSADSAGNLPRPGATQAARRIFEQQRNASSMTPRRTTNYLQQKLAGGDMVGPDMGSDESPRPANSSDLLREFDSKGDVPRKMANHVRECLAEFNTGLDKLLGAIKEVENNSQLTPSDRDTLLRVLESALSQGKRRLLQAETVGSTPRTSDATSRRTSDESDTASIYQRTSAPAPTSTPSIDLNFLNQHGAQLIELLKQNMAKQN